MGMSTICKLFPDAEICNDSGLISTMEQEGEKLLKQAEGELLPTDINLTSGLKRQKERGGNQMEEDIVSAIVQEGDALISGIEQMLGDLFSAIEKEDDSIVSAIEKQGGKQMEREGNQMERQEASVISKHAERYMPI